MAGRCACSAMCAGCVRGCTGGRVPISLSSLSLWTEVQVDKNSGTAMAHTCGSCGGAVLSVASHLRAVGSTLRGGRGPLGPGLASGLPRGCLGVASGAAWGQLGSGDDAAFFGA